VKCEAEKDGGRRLHPDNRNSESGLGVIVSPSCYTALLKHDETALAQARRSQDAAKKERHPQCPVLINLLAQVPTFMAQAVATPLFAIRTMSITSIMAICTTLKASITRNTLLKCPK
jgi:hypothetical protein